MRLQKQLEYVYPELLVDTRWVEDHLMTLPCVCSKISQVYQLVIIIYQLVIIITLAVVLMTNIPQKSVAYKTIKKYLETQGQETSITILSTF